MKPTYHLFIILMAAALSCACSSDDNGPADGPTAASAIVAGHVFTTSGRPLANVPVSIVGGVSAKATAMTDADGFYRLWFNPERRREGGAYALHVDLNSLSDTDYILPSTYDAGAKDNTLVYSFGSEIGCGVSVEHNVYVPRRKSVTVSVTLSGIDQPGTSYCITNSLSYGGSRLPDVPESSDGRLVVRVPVVVPPSGECVVTVPCAPDEVNVLTLCRSEHYSIYFDPVSDPLELLVTDDMAEPVRLALSAVPSEARFRLEISSHTPLMNEDFPLPAPFDLVTFRIKDADGHWPVTGNPVYRQYYDSIVWCADGLPDTMRVYCSRSDAGVAEERLTSQWSSYFFKGGNTRHYLKGYRDGRVVHADSLQLRLYDRDFLGFDWTGSVALVEYNSGVYCRLDREFEYGVSHPMEVSGHRYTRIWPLGMAETESVRERSLAALRRLMQDNLGPERPFDSGTVRQSFVCLPDDAVPLEMYENRTTRALVYLVEATEDCEERYYIHAESK